MTWPPDEVSRRVLAFDSSRLSRTPNAHTQQPEESENRHRRREGLRAKADELLRLDIDSLPKIKIDDFSMHQIPTSNMLRELRDNCGIEIVIVVCYMAGKCDSVDPGLSTAVEMAWSYAAEILSLGHFKWPGRRRVGPGKVMLPAHNLCGHVATMPRAGMWPKDG